ncbi:uncharacterized protein LOC143174228, partial [Nomia melanderi]|uniref:uncharacterized protein LOC143174228 n=1 Tax=Nomia melanderi TaxID=2448451 RepID=UPI003FCCE12D
SLKKRLVSIGWQKRSRNTIAIHRKPCIVSSQVTKLGFMRMIPKVNSSRLRGSSKMSQTQQKSCARSTSKQIVVYFFCKTGHVATVALEDRRTVNSDWYTTICLPEVFGEIRKKNRRRRIILQHDNASLYISAQTSFLTP